MAKLRRKTMNKLAELNIPIRRGMTEEQAQGLLAGRDPGRDRLAPRTRPFRETPPTGQPEPTPELEPTPEEQQRFQQQQGEPAPDFAQSQQTAPDKAQGLLNWVKNKFLSMSPISLGIKLDKVRKGEASIREFFEDAAGMNFAPHPKADTIKDFFQKAAKAVKTGDYKELSPKLFQELELITPDSQKKEAEGVRQIGDIGQEFGLQKLEPEQLDFIKDLLGPEGALKKALTPTPVSELEQQFEPIAEAARAGLHKQIPGLMERFTALTGGGQRTGAIRPQIEGAKSALETQLAGQRGQFVQRGQELGQQRLQSLLGAGLQPTKEPVFKPTAPGFLEQFLKSPASGSLMEQGLGGIGQLLRGLIAGGL